MSNDKHTPTPWTKYGFEVFNENRRKRIADCENTDDADRIVQCVNACEGLSDEELQGIGKIKPFHEQMHELSKLTSAELATLRAEKAELIEALKQIEVYKDGDTWLQDIIAIKKFASQTLAKLKTK